MRVSRLIALVPLLIVLNCCSSAHKAPIAMTGVFDSNGTRISYTVQGAGEPVILIHGFSVDIEFNWRAPAILDSLAKDFRVIAMDVRGHGRSDKPHNREAYGREVLLDVKRLMDHLRIEKAHLVGYSMGGEITLSFLVYFPERVSKAVVGGAGWVEAGDRKHELWRTYASLLKAITPGVSVSEQLFPGVVIPETVRHVADANDPAALSAVAYGMLALTIEEQALRNNSVPTLFIVGENDPFKFCADKALAVGSHMEMKVLAGQNHLSAIADPGFVGAVREFLLSD